MSMGTLSEVAAAVGGTLHGEDRQVASVTTDSRAVNEGQLFIALKGERYDAADFVPEAMRKGAAGALVAGRVDCDLPQITVADTRVALGDFARYWRQRMDADVLAITGSNGKTTVKEMIASIMRSLAARSGGEVLVTEGNYNNDIGMPLTLLRLRPQHRWAVIEMGANHVGEIAWLAGVALPRVGLITNAGPAHLEGFGSLERVAAGKAELLEALPADGVAVLNRDDRFYPLWLEKSSAGRSVSFGLAADADYSATAIRHAHGEEGDEIHFRLRREGGSTDIALPMAGAHNVVNALAAVAMTAEAGAGEEDWIAGLAAMHNVSGRLRELRGRGGVTIYDDSYNANPASLRAGIEFLGGVGGETWLVLGDMAELGPQTETLHREVGLVARRAGISRLYTLGEASRHAADAFGSDAHSFDAIDALGDALEQDWRGGITVLVKGSHCMELERLVRRFVNGGSEH